MISNAMQDALNEQINRQSWVEVSDLLLYELDPVFEALEQKLASERVEARTERLGAALDSLPEGTYEYALIDCPPNVGVLTFNALRAATEVIIPLETSRFAIHGVEKLLETIALLTERIGHDLSVRVLTTLYDGRTRFARTTLAEIRDQLMLGSDTAGTAFRAEVEPDLDSLIGFQIGP